MKYLRLYEEFLNGTALGAMPNNLPDEVKNVSQIPDELGQKYDRLTLNDIITYVSNQQNTGGFKCDKQENEVSFDIDHFKVQVMRDLEESNKFKYFVLIDGSPIDCENEVGERIFGLSSGGVGKNDVRMLLGQI